MLVAKQFLVAIDLHSMENNIVEVNGYTSNCLFINILDLSKCKSVAIFVMQIAILLSSTLLCGCWRVLVVF